MGQTPWDKPTPEFQKLGIRLFQISDLALQILEIVSKVIQKELRLNLNSSS